MNMSDKVHGNKDRKHSEETKRKMSEAQNGKKNLQSEEFTYLFLNQAPYPSRVFVGCFLFSSSTTGCSSLILFAKSLIKFDSSSSAGTGYSLDSLTPIDFGFY